MPPIHAPVCWLAVKRMSPCFAGPLLRGQRSFDNPRNYFAGWAPLPQQRSQAVRETLLSTRVPRWPSTRWGSSGGFVSPEVRLRVGELARLCRAAASRGFFVCKDVRKGMETQTQRVGRCRERLRLMSGAFTTRFAGAEAPNTTNPSSRGFAAPRDQSHAQTLTQGKEWRSETRRIQRCRKRLRSLSCAFAASDHPLLVKVQRAVRNSP